MNYANDPEAVMNVPMVLDPSGRLIYFDDVGDMQVPSSLSSLERRDSERLVSITGDLVEFSFSVRKAFQILFWIGIMTGLPIIPGPVWHLAVKLKAQEKLCYFKPRAIRAVVLMRYFSSPIP